MTAREKVRQLQREAAEFAKDPNRPIFEWTDDLIADDANYQSPDPEQLARDNAMVLEMVAKMDPSEFIQMDYEPADELDRLNIFELVQAAEDEDIEELAKFGGLC